MVDYRIRKQLPHGRPDWVDDRCTLFVTLCHKQRGVSHFNSEKAWDALLHSAEHLHARGKWEPLLILAMPDHLHALVRIPRRYDIGKVIGWFKRTISYRHPTSWQADGFDHRIRGQAEYLAKRAYILQNPVRAGMVEHSEDWPYRKSWE
jgi:REP element-mobilizing transposase RayT